MAKKRKTVVRLEKKMVTQIRVNKIGLSKIELDFSELDPVHIPELVYGNSDEGIPYSLLMGRSLPCVLMMVSVSS
jgi:hypothetical protein